MFTFGCMLAFLSIRKLYNFPWSLTTFYMYTISVARRVRSCLVDFKLLIYVIVQDFVVDLHDVDVDLHDAVDVHNVVDLHDIVVDL